MVQWLRLCASNAGGGTGLIPDWGTGIPHAGWSKKKKKTPVRWMNLEPIMQSEVSQKEKDKYCILTDTYGT